MNKKKILVIGSLNMDMVVNMSQMPRVGETVTGESITYFPGGKGANQAYAAGRLGGNVTMLGAVGNDEHGNALTSSLASVGVDVSRILVSNAHHTGTASIYVDQNGDNAIVVIPGANAACNVSYLKANDAAFEACDIVLLQMEIPADAVFYSIKRAKELGKLVVLNPAPISGPLPDEIVSLVDYLAPNETELIKLTGLPDTSLANINLGRETLLAKGTQHLLITLGEKGAMIASKTEQEIYPTRKVKAIDTVAAGDCFIAAFVVGISEGKTIADAIRFANAASSITVTRIGAQASIPSRDEVNACLLTGEWTC